MQIKIKSKTSETNAQHMHAESWQKKGDLAWYGDRVWLYHSIFIAASAILLSSTGAWAVSNQPAPIPPTSTENYSFNPIFIRGNHTGDKIDLNQLNHSLRVPAGTYNVDLFVNGSFRKTADIVFKMTANGEVSSCLPYDFLLDLGVKPEAMQEPSSTDCLIVQQAIKGGSEIFDSNQLQLNLSIPESEMLRLDANYVPISDWDSGESALFINYMANYYRSTSRHNEGTDSATQESQFFSFNSGINLGLWRLRNNSTYNKEKNSSGHFNSYSTYLQRALPDIRSELTAGETYTNGRLFDSLSFRGVQLTSDDRMLAENQRGYAPTINGIANSNARVKVFQNNELLYETTVAPGHFTINDLIPITHGGDFTVEVTESDGSINRFVVPYSAINESLRPGLSLYSFTLGRTHQNNKEQVNFAELGYERGMSNIVTLNAGLQASTQDYYAATSGLVLSTWLGALGFNATYSNFNAKKSKGDGWLLKTAYNRKFTTTDTNLTLANYRYATSGFTTLSDSLRNQDYRHNNSDGFYSNSANQQQNRFEIRVAQNMADYGSLSANLMIQSYYHNQSRDIQYQLSYHNHYRHFNYNISLLRQENQRGKSNNVATLGFSIPLWRGTKAPLLSASTTQGSNKQSTVQSRLSGLLGKDSQFNYALSANRDMHNHTNGAGLAVNQITSFGNYGGSYNYSSNAHQYSLNAQGAAVLHAGGVTLTSYLGETFGIVEAKGARGARLSNVYRATIDRFGYAIVPSLSPYNYNQINIDPTNMRGKVELKQTQKYIAPYAGAMVKIHFPTSIGHALLITSFMADNTPLPLGANIYDQVDREIGMIGQGSRAYARVDNDSGKIWVKWGADAHQRCSISYNISEEMKEKHLIKLKAPCVNNIAAQQ